MHRLAGSLVAAAVLGVLVFVPAGVAGQPVTQTLTPEPPSFYSCKAVGVGVLCQGSRPLSYGPVDIGISCGSGASAFDIWDRGAYEQRAMRWYDANGNLVQRVVHENYNLGEFTNRLTGATVTYSQVDTITDVLAVPGDLSSATETEEGQNIYRGADGRIVFMNAGRTVHGADGNLEFRSGPQNFLDYFVDGDTSVIAPLCAALGG
jgi:hypothetical protein